jgi:hypothetical protein
MSQRGEDRELRKVDTSKVQQAMLKLREQKLAQAEVLKQR